MAFDYNIIYKPGSQIADALSRMEDDDSAETCCSVEVGFCNSSLIDADKLRDELACDIVHNIMTRIKSGIWSNCSEAEGPFKMKSHFMTIQNNLIYNGTRPYIPPRFRQTVMENAHSVHNGVSATQVLLRSMAWWPGMDYDLQRFIEKCQQCQMLRPRVQKQIDTWPHADIWERIHMDWAYVKDHGNILIIVDAGSGWIEAFPCNDRSTANVIKCLSATFARFGVPYKLVSDNAKEFISDELIKWLETQGCQKIETPPYYPKANGLAERGVQTVKRAMKAWSSDLRVSFHAYLMRVLMTHRNSSNAREKTPSELLTNRKVRIPAIIDFPIGGDVVYKPTPKSESMKATYIMRKGSNTAWIQKDERTILASSSQIAGISKSDDLPIRHDEETADPPEFHENIQDTTKVLPKMISDQPCRPRQEVVEANLAPRRSARSRQPHPKYRDFLMDIDE